MSATSSTVWRGRARALSVSVPWKLVRIVAFYLGLLGLWQLIYLGEFWPAYIVPGPNDVYESLRYLSDRGDLWEAIATTMRRMAEGYALAIAIGLVLGLCMGTMKWVDETVGSLVLGLQSLPSVTWFPLALLWFGLNERAIIFVVLMGSLGSIAISARTGVRSIPPLQLRAARMFGGRRWQMLGFVILPAVLPSMLQGLKLAWSFAWRSLVAAELLYASVSLGYLLEIGKNNVDVGQVVAIMLIIVTIGIMMDRLVFGLLERWVNDRWGLASR